MCRMLSLITMIAVLCSALASVHISYETQSCSDLLDDLLERACNGNFNGIPIQKRGMIASDVDPLDPIQYVEATEAHPLFRGRFHGGEGVLNSLAPIRRLTRQGIVDSCCKNSCKPSFLRLYCAAPST